MYFRLLMQVWCESRCFKLYCKGLWPRRGYGKAVWNGGSGIAFFLAHIGTARGDACTHIPSAISGQQWIGPFLRLLTTKKLFRSMCTVLIRRHNRHAQSASETANLSKFVRVATGIHEGFLWIKLLRNPLSARNQGVSEKPHELWFCRTLPCRLADSARRGRRQPKHVNGKTGHTRRSCPTREWLRHNA